jgi:hypothetical protein
MKSIRILLNLYLNALCAIKLDFVLSLSLSLSLYFRVYNWECLATSEFSLFLSLHFSIHSFSVDKLFRPKRGRQETLTGSCQILFFSCSQFFFANYAFLYNGLEQKGSFFCQILVIHIMKYKMCNLFSYRRHKFN